MDNLFEALQQVVGKEYFISDADKLSAYNTGTFPAKNKCIAVIKPADDDEIIKILSALTDYNQNSSEKVNLFTVSSGKNWGYSSQEPSAQNAILMKLSRLKSITDYDNKQGTITVSAGVTQIELYNYLQSQGGDFWMDATGASVDCSIVGNTVERGFGHTPYGDHFDNVCGLEVILASGEKINTGFKQFNKGGVTPVAANHYKWGIGPYIDGLFTQANFGIVTKMTIWLMPKPEHFEAFFISIKDPNDLPALIDAVQPLKLSGIIKSSAHIGNDDKAIQALSFYPWDGANGKTPLPEQIKNKLKKRFMVNAWSISGAFYGSKAEVRIWKKMLKCAVKGVADDIKFLDNRMVNIADKVKSILTLVTPIDFNTNVPLLKKVMELKQGVPTDYFIPSTYWRKKQKPDISKKLDPTKDNVGLIWLAPIAPIDGDHVKSMVNIIVPIIKKYEFEPGISITLLTERTLDCVVSLVYDRDVAGEDQRALDCHDELFEALTSKGYFPYRLSSHAHQAFNEIDSSLQPLLKTFKEEIDPQRILSPNKYGI